MSLNMVCAVCEGVYDVTTTHVCPPMKDWPESQILAVVHDLLVERLSKPPTSWTTPEYTCPSCPDSAQNATQESLGGDSGTQGHQGGSVAHSGDSGIRPEPESVTLPRDVVDVAWARLEVAASDPAASQEYATRHGAAADALLAALNAATTPNPATGDDLSAPQSSETPADGEGAERPTAANLGRIGWMRPSMSEPWFLVHEAPDGWSEDSTNDALWFADEQPDAIFTPFTPADFGWTVLGEGQVAVDMRPVWRDSTPAGWRKEAEILRKERPDALAAAALCEQFADALDGGQS